jgi:tetratricopeptide (TPR) repeat protein
VELDPEFARAYVGLSVHYANLNQAGRAAENALKAYDLRGKVGDRERFAIEAIYRMVATGELDKAVQVYELWQQIYPRDFLPYGNLSFIYLELGSWEEALNQGLEAIRLAPNSNIGYINAGTAYLGLNRLQEAEATFKQAEGRGLGSEGLLDERYQLAFLKGDGAWMARLVADGIGKAGIEDSVLAMQADTQAWYGKLKSARELTGRATDSAKQNDASETVAAYRAAAALREVESGNWERGRAEADAAVKLAPDRDVQGMAALALARSGDTVKAEKLAAELNHSFPSDTLVQKYWLPTVRAAVALEHNAPDNAIEALKASSAIELGQPAKTRVFLAPAYLRGEAYLMLRDGNSAAAEFRKFIDYRGVVGNGPLGAVARLGLARAYAIEAETEPTARDKARAAYQDFMTLWKDADPDIPIYRRAKTEYKKLQATS